MTTQELCVPDVRKVDLRTNVSSSHEPRPNELRSMPEPRRVEVNRPPTLGQVAQLAGVSIATASRVLNNSAPVSVQARQQVRDAVVRLGYVRHRAAPTAPRVRTRSVAVVVCANNVRFFGDPFVTQVISGASEACAARDIPLSVIPVTDDRIALVERYLRGGHVDGVLLLGAHVKHPLAVSLPAAGMPVAMVGRPVQPTRMSYVDADNRGGAVQAVEHLVSKGRRAIATIAGRQDVSVGLDRLAGYRAGMAAAGRAPVVVYGDFTHASGVHAMWRLLDQRPALDAVFVASDVMAAGALHALRKAGRRVPDDVAVVGFDDLPMAKHTQPPLTTVHQPIDQFGGVAADLLFAAIDGTSHSIDPVLPTTLVVRETT